MIDIERNFIYLPLAQYGRVLSGVDFNGGGSLLGGIWHKREVWIVDQRGKRPLLGELQVVHRQRMGHVLELFGNDALSFPCLLTTDPSMRWIYSGAIQITSRAGTFGIGEFSETLGIPLCGTYWLGVARRFYHHIWLDAYGAADTGLEQEATAFSPDWADRFDRETGEFMVEKIDSIYNRP